MSNILPIAVTISDGPDERTVRELLSENRLDEALRASLCSPPSRNSAQEKKETAIVLVKDVIVSFKTSDVKNSVDKLTSEQGDILMNYVYKAMAVENEAAVDQLLLVWHSHLFARFGHGAIVRVFSERLLF